MNLTYKWIRDRIPKSKAFYIKFDGNATSKTGLRCTKPQTLSNTSKTSRTFFDFQTPRGAESFLSRRVF